MAGQLGERELKTTVIALCQMNLAGGTVVAPASGISPVSRVVVERIWRTVLSPRTPRAHNAFGGRLD